MAKGLRASTNKANKTKLRSKVFAPVEISRNERLSAKLLEIVSKPKPPLESDVKMSESVPQGAHEAATHDAANKALPNDEVMNVDEGSTSKVKRRRQGGSGKIHKVNQRKRGSSIVFKVGRKDGPKSRTKQKR